MTESLCDRVALVTGASSGIGEATALALARAGARVAVTARREDRLQRVMEALSAIGHPALTIPGNVADPGFAQYAIDTTIAQLGGLDILVNSAGLIQAGRVMNADLHEWKQVMDVNFFGTLYMCRAALPPMMARKRGDIVNISSISGRRHSAALFGAYAPSKHAVNAMSEALRQEAGTAGIRVCVIEPGATSTEVFDGMSDPEWREKMRAHVGREDAILSTDVANAICYVAAQPANVNISELMIRPTGDILPL